MQIKLGTVTSVFAQVGGLKFLPPFIAKVPLYFWDGNCFHTYGLNTEMLRSITTPDLDLVQRAHCTG